MKITKKMMLAILSVGLIGVAQANVINFNLNLDATRGGVTVAEGVMDGVSFTGTEAPLAYAGSTWNDYVLTAGTNVLVDSEGGAGYSLIAPNNFAKWGNPGYVSGVTAGYGYGLSGQTWTITGLGAGTELNVYVMGEDANPAVSRYTISGIQQTNTTTATPPATWTEGANYSVWNSVYADASGNLAITMDAGVLSGFQVEVVPEPATLAFVGLFGFGMYIRRKLFS